MKLLFENEKEQKEFVKTMASSNVCPENYDLEEKGCNGVLFGILGCRSCWEYALKDMMHIEETPDKTKDNIILEVHIEPEDIIRDCMEMLSCKSNAKCTNDARWIPCSERLPEKPRAQYDSYIVQEETVITPYTAYWDGEIWTDTDGDAIKGVIAWMPLPEVYTREENNE